MLLPQKQWRNFVFLIFFSSSFLILRHCFCGYLFYGKQAASFKTSGKFWHPRHCFNKMPEILVPKLVI